MTRKLIYSKGGKLYDLDYEKRFYNILSPKRKIKYHLQNLANNVHDLYEGIRYGDPMNKPSTKLYEMEFEPGSAKEKLALFTAKHLERMGLGSDKTVKKKKKKKKK